MTDLMVRAQEVLSDLWGFPDFKKAQRQVIEHVLDGDDVLAVLATGYGKSVTFQVPAMVLDGCCIVVSPLIALMKDQVDAAQAKGIPASYVNSHVEPDEAAERYADLKAGAFKLFYIAPERVGNRQFRAALAATHVCLIAVDEAHCASMWGHDFRPAYQRLSEIGDILFEATKDRPPILAVTATATTDIEDDIVTGLGMVDECVRVVGDPIRPNIYYERVQPYSSEWGILRRQIQEHFTKPGRHIVYCSTRKACSTTADIIAEVVGGASGYYHGGMLKPQRIAIQEAFVSGKLRCIAATNAFGMGIDVPDIRTVIHFGVPGSIESYVQETGRAGRDGKDSTVVLIDSDFSTKLQRQFIDDANPPIAAYEFLWAWLHEVIAHAQGGVLRMSSADIASAVSGNLPPGRELTTAQVATILNAFDGHRLVRRNYYAGGTPVMCYVDALKPTNFSGNRAKIAAELIKLAVAKDPDSSSVMVDVEKVDMAHDLGVAPGTITSNLNKLEEAGACVVSETFTGKTTELCAALEDLHDRLPVEFLERKRKRDNERFGAMLSYQSAPDPKKFIRDYFTGRAVQGGRREARDEPF